MSKAILVIDMPDECRNCPCFNGLDFAAYCGKEDKKIEYDIDNLAYTKPIWCPLKALPEKIEYKLLKGIDYSNGWNDCLDEILGT